MMKEQKETGSDKFYLDISYKDPEFIKNRFPMIYNKVLEKGYDMTKEPIPIYPCQHYLMGGIGVNGHGATNVKGLYAEENVRIPASTASTALQAILCLKRWYSAVLSQRT